MSALGALNGLGDPDADPPGFLRALVAREMEEWSSPAARQLISLMSHDNMLHSPALRQAIASTLGSLAEVFARWMAGGLAGSRALDVKRDKLVSRTFQLGGQPASSTRT